MHDLLLKAKDPLKFPFDIDSESIDNWTALHLATSAGHLKIMEKLIDSGANIEAETTLKRTPLHIAAIRGNIEAVRTLVMKSAKVNAQDDDDNTPLHIASERGFGEIVEFLLINNADPKRLNSYRKTPIDLSQNENTRKIYDRFITEEEKYGLEDFSNGILHNGRKEQGNRCLKEVQCHDNVSKK